MPARTVKFLLPTQTGACQWVRMATPAAGHCSRLLSTFTLRVVNVLGVLTSIQDGRLLEIDGNLAEVTMAPNKSAASHRMTPFCTTDLPRAL